MPHRGRKPGVKLGMIDLVYNLTSPPSLTLSQPEYKKYDDFAQRLSTDKTFELRGVKPFSKKVSHYLCFYIGGTII